MLASFELVMGIIFVVLCIALVALFFLDDLIQFAGPICLALGCVVVTVSCVEYVADGRHVYWKASGVFLLIGAALVGGMLLLRSVRWTKKKPKDS